jgi:hypothetical protein
MVWYACSAAQILLEHLLLAMNYSASARTALHAELAMRTPALRPLSTVPVISNQQAPKHTVAL